MEHFDGGQPDPNREVHQPPHFGHETYYVMTRTWITRSVVAAVIALPVLVIGAALLGLSAAVTPLVAAALAPLGFLANAIARFFF